MARERYEGLRADLDVAARGSGEGLTSASDGGSGQDGELLLLLKARERRRRLGAVERAVEAVEREGKGVVGAKIDDVVKKSVGDVPVLPNQRSVISGGGGREEGEMRMVELKKAILGARATIEKCTKEKPPVDSQVSGKDELFALQQSRNELIGWIERQLALIGDAQAEDDKEVSSPTRKNGEDEEDGGGHVATNEEINQLYDRYLEARRTLLDSLQESSDISPLAPAPESPKQAPPSSDNDVAATTAITLLPFVEPLLTTKTAEQDIIHQAAYIRRQLSSADATSERLLRRLADESHLVHPGASRGRDWARAGEEASELTRDFVLARAKAGEVASKEADALLSKLDGVTEGLERLAKS